MRDNTGKDERFEYACGIFYSDRVSTAIVDDVERATFATGCCVWESYCYAVTCRSDLK
jgi:hypothetical protein